MHCVHNNLCTHFKYDNRTFLTLKLYLFDSSSSRRLYFIYFCKLIKFICNRIWCCCKSLLVLLLRSSHPEVSCKKRVIIKIRKFHRRTPVWTLWEHLQLYQKRDCAQSGASFCLLQIICHTERVYELNVFLLSVNLLSLRNFS